MLNIYDEIIKSNMKIKHVADSCKKMPPLVIEMMAIVVNNLPENKKKFDEFLHKILAIETDV